MSEPIREQLVDVIASSDPIGPGITEPLGEVTRGEYEAMADAILSRWSLSPVGETEAANEVEWGVEYEVSSTETDFIPYVDRANAEHDVGSSPTDTALVWRRVTSWKRADESMPKEAR